MTTLKRLRAWLSAILGRSRMERDMDTELSFHIQAYADDLILSGVPREEALRQARLAFGGVDRAKEECRDARGVNLLDGLIQDARYGARMLRKNSIFTAVVVVTLGLGIGANAAIFTVINSVLLNPLPYGEPERLVLMWERTPKLASMMVSYPDYLDWKAQNHVFEDIAVYNRYQTFNLTGRDRPERLAGGRATTNLFTVLGVQPALGRGFLPEEEGPGGARVAILTDALWKRLFVSDPNVVGQNITLSGQSYTVVGILPPAIQFGGVELWVPLGEFVNDNVLKRANHNGLTALGRLSPGVTLDQARADMDAIAHGLELQYPDSNAQQGINYRLLTEVVVGGIRPALRILWEAVGLVLMIACANVANLMLARSSSRRRETVVRAALGARRMRLVRQFLIESLLLAASGGAFGLFLAWLGIRLLVKAEPPGIPRLSQIHIDSRVLMFTAGIALLTPLIFGVLPAARATRVDSSGSLKEGGRTAGRIRERLRSGLAISEVGLAVMLLIGAGLMIRSFWALRSVDRGFQPDSVMVARINLPPAVYPDRARISAFYEQLSRRLESLPGVEYVGLTSYLPLSVDGNQTPALVEGDENPDLDVQRMPVVDFTRIRGSYFRAMGIRLIRGRAFTEEDQRENCTAAIVNETAMRRFWPGVDDPVGKRLKANGIEAERPWLEVVGVVSDIRKDDAASAIRPEVYVPQATTAWPQMSIVARAGGNPGLLGPEIRDAVRGLDRDLPVYSVRPLEAFVSDSVGQPRFTMTMLGIFAGLALVLAMVGVYGVLSYLVSQRTNEIGIRVALGAGRGNILKLVLGNALALAAGGTAIGIVAALAANRLLADQLYGVKPTDLVSFCAGPAALLVLALVAAYVPARRAAQVDPMVSLRYE
jgi:putative ABC transport system permease protein